MENEQKIDWADIAHLAYEGTNQSGNEKFKTVEQLKKGLSTYPSREQLDYMKKLVNPNNINGAMPSKEYGIIKECVMSNIAKQFADKLYECEKSNKQLSADELLSYFADTVNNFDLSSDQLYQLGRSLSAQETYYGVESKYVGNIKASLAPCIQYVNDLTKRKELENNDQLEQI